MNENAIELLNEQSLRLNNIKKTLSGNYGAMDVNTWINDTISIVESFFGKENLNIQVLNKIRNLVQHDSLSGEDFYYINDINIIGRFILQSCIDDLSDFYS